MIDGLFFGRIGWIERYDIRQLNIFEPRVPNPCEDGCVNVFIYSISVLGALVIDSIDEHLRRRIHPNPISSQIFEEKVKNLLVTALILGSNSVVFQVASASTSD